MPKRSSSWPSLFYHAVKPKLLDLKTSFFHKIRPTFHKMRAGFHKSRASLLGTLHLEDLAPPAPHQLFLEYNLKFYRLWIAPLFGFRFEARAVLFVFARQALQD